MQSSRSHGPNRDNFMTPAEVAEWIQIPERTLIDWRYRRTGPAFLKIGRRVRYREADVLTWLTEQVTECRYSAPPSGGR